MRYNGALHFDRTPLGAYCGSRGIATLQYVLYLRGWIVYRHRLDRRMTMEELLTLSQYERMRERPPDISQLRARQADQRVLDAAYRFCDDRQVVGKNQVVCLVK